MPMQPAIGHRLLAATDVRWAMAMKGELFGFRQRKLVEFGLDLVDALLLRWFADYIASGTMKRTEHEGQEYFWVQFQKCIEDLPVMGITNPEVVSRHFGRLEKAGFVVKYLKKTGGTYTYFHLVEHEFASLCGKKAPLSPLAEKEPPKKWRGDAEAVVRKSISKKVAEVAEQPENERRLSAEALQFLGEVIRRGGFTNKLPDNPETLPTKVLLTAQVYLWSMKAPGFRRRFETLDDEWLSGSGIDFSYFRKTTESRDEIVLKAVDRFALMRNPDYEPVVKSNLPKSLDEFFYSYRTKRSWFLYCVFNEPITLKKKVSAIERYENIGLGDEAKAAVEKLRGKGWDRESFLRKIVKLYEWYEANRKNVQACDNVDGVGLWKDHFDPFSKFLDRYYDFSKTWKDWGPGNFGYGNPTWKCFEAWCRDTYKGLELAPSERLLKRVWTKLAKDEEKRKAEKEAANEREQQLRKLCPYGHIFGKETDKFHDHCDECPKGTECYRAGHPNEKSGFEISYKI